MGGFQYPVYAVGDRVWYPDGMPAICYGTVEGALQHPEDSSHGAILVRWDDGQTVIDGFLMMTPDQLEPAEEAPSEAPVPDSVPDDIDEY